MSLNYCEKNPVQGIRNAHCYHAKGRPRGRGPVRKQVEVCCWCGQQAGASVFTDHGPIFTQGGEVR